VASDPTALPLLVRALTPHPGTLPAASLLLMESLLTQLRLPQPVVSPYRLWFNMRVHVLTSVKAQLSTLHRATRLPVLTPQTLPAQATSLALPAPLPADLTHQTPPTRSIPASTLITTDTLPLALARLAPLVAARG